MENDEEDDDILNVEFDPKELENIDEDEFFGNNSSSSSARNSRISPPAPSNVDDDESERFSVEECRNDEESSDKGEEQDEKEVEDEEEEEEEEEEEDEAELEDRSKFHSERRQGEIRPIAARLSRIGERSNIPDTLDQVKLSDTDGALLRDPRWRGGGGGGQKNHYNPNNHNNNNRRQQQQFVPNQIPQPPTTTSTNKVLLNPHFQGSVPFRPQIRLAWDASSGAVSFPRSSAPPPPPITPQRIYRHRMPGMEVIRPRMPVSAGIHHQQQHRPPIMPPSPLIPHIPVPVQPLLRMQPHHQHQHQQQQHHPAPAGHPPQQLQQSSSFHHPAHHPPPVSSSSWSQQQSQSMVMMGARSPLLSMASAGQLGSRHPFGSAGGPTSSMQQQMIRPPPIPRFNLPPPNLCPAQPQLQLNHQPPGGPDLKTSPIKPAAAGNADDDWLNMTAEFLRKTQLPPPFQTRISVQSSSSSSAGSSSISGGPNPYSSYPYPSPANPYPNLNPSPAPAASRQRRAADDVKRKYKNQNDRQKKLQSNLSRTPSFDDRYPEPEGGGREHRVGGGRLERHPSSSTAGDGVDLEYLRQMDDLKRKREEFLKRKEANRALTAQKRQQQHQSGGPPSKLQVTLLGGGGGPGPGPGGGVRLAAAANIKRTQISLTASSSSASSSGQKSQSVIRRGGRV